MNRLSLFILSLAFILNACTTTKEVIVEDRTNPLIKDELDQDRQYQIKARTKDGSIVNNNDINSQTLILTDASEPEDLLAQKRQQDTLAANDDTIQSDDVDHSQVEAVDAAQVEAVDDSQEESTSNDSQTEQTNNPILYFAYDSVNLDKESVTLLVTYAKKMQQDESLKLRLEGHTDERGSRNYNLALGENRALVVRDVFILYDVAHRIEVVSYGEEKPQASEHNEEAWQKNRRVELIFY